MDAWDRYLWGKLDQSIIVYGVDDGKVYGGSEPGRIVKQVEKDSDGNYPGGDFTMELDLSNRSLVMEVDNKKITIDGNIGDFEYSPIIILRNKQFYTNLEITLL